MIEYARVVSALQQHWMLHGPAEIPTIYPGVEASSVSLKEWIEFWVTQGQELPVRSVNSGRMSVLVDVNCFHRSPDKHAILRTADMVRRRLERTVIRIGSGADCGATEISLRTFEGVVRDLTRDSNLNSLSSLQHLVISFHAIVQQSNSNIFDH